MPNSTVNLAPYNVQAEQLARKRAMAQALQQQSMQPLEDPGVPGAKISPVQGFAKLAQALVSAYQMKKLDKQESALSAQQQSDKERTLGEMAKVLMPTDYSSQGMDQLPAMQSPVPALQGAMPQGPMVQQPPEDPNAQAARQQALAKAMSSNTPEGQMMGGALIKQYDTTQTRKQAQADKLEQMGMAEAAARRNKELEMSKLQVLGPGAIGINGSGQTVASNPVAKPSNPIIADANPSDFTPASLAEYQKTGDPSKLARTYAPQNPAQPTPPLSAERFKQEKEMAALREAATAANRTDSQDRLVKNEALKIYSPAQDSAERMNVMTQNFSDATKNKDQQAMLSLLANHLAMTMGLAKGARITQAVMNEAVASRPWLQGAASKFDKDGYLSGITLTPTQMQQMVDLGRGRFTQDLQKAHSSAQYVGIQDGGPERIPSAATKAYYGVLAGGDKAKAQALATADGWTIK